jgi:hypothetical protein
MIRDRNQLDIDLYEYAKNLFENALIELGSTFRRDLLIHTYLQAGCQALQRGGSWFRSGLGKQLVGH